MLAEGRSPKPGSFDGALSSSACSGQEKPSGMHFGPSRAYPVFGVSTMAASAQEEEMIQTEHRSGRGKTEPGVFRQPG